MKVITLDSPLKIGIKNIPKPERKDDNEVLIKVRALGICGSDIGAYRGVNPTVSYPRIIGHEIGDWHTSYPASCTGEGDPRMSLIIYIFKRFS